MAIRIITGLLLALLVILGIIYFPPMIIKIIVAGLAGFGSYECARMILPKHPSSSLLLPTLLGTILAAWVMFGVSYSPLAWILGVPFVVLVTFGFYLIQFDSPDLVLSQISLTLLTIFYVGFLFSFLGLIRDLPVGPSWLFLVLATTFGADTGAYFIGKFLGRNKLYPRVSPGKTVEGLIGGIILSIGVAFLIKYLIFKEISYLDCWMIGTLVGGVGPVGDLAESLIKRSVGVKDSGNIIPGHGGFLDRVDALLFTAPVVYCYALFFKL